MSNNQFRLILIFFGALLGSQLLMWGSYAFWLYLTGRL
jgi:hypothetical protein